MARRSRLLATVAFPFVSLSLLVNPAGATGMRPDIAGVVSSDVVKVQAAEDEQPVRRKPKNEQQAQEGQAPEGQPSREERRKQRQQEQQQRQQEQQAAPEGEQQGQTREERRKQRQQEQQQRQQEQQQGAPEGEQQGQSREERRKQRQQEQQQRQQEQQQAQPEAAPEGGQQGQTREERRKAREERQKQQLEQQQLQEQQQQAEQPEAAPEGGQQGQTREERRKAREERQKQQLEQQQLQEQQQQQAEQPEAAPEGGQQGQTREERRKAREERQKQLLEQQQLQEQQQQVQPEAAPEGGQQGQTREERRKAREERQKQLLEQQQLQEQQPEGQQLGQPAGRDAPEVRERKRRNAENPAATDETIVLPVDNGAAVLDSDKDAERAGNAMTREERRKLRAERRDIRVPTSDADAQIDNEGRARPPVRIDRVTREEGRALRERPRYEMPEGVNIRDRRDNRIVVNIDNRTIVRNDDSYRFRRQGERVTYEGLSNGRVREVVVRPNGDRVVTVRNRWGDVIRRSRVDAREREYVLFYSPELYDNPDQRYVYRDPGVRLPPMRLAIPVQDYIIDTSSEPDRDYYAFLEQPPVEPVERVYTLDEVKYSARIRDKVRRIDLDTITFATGSAEIPMSQAQTLRKVADAINQALDNDPAETFLIEGHTDAVGSDESNLILSDERAESVANVLSDVYGIPPENLTTQGYGEQFLKVNTQSAEQQNRRVTIRRVTALVRPAEMAQE